MLWIEVFKLDENGDSQTVQTFDIRDLEEAIGMKRTSNEPLHIDIWEGDPEGGTAPEPIIEMNFQSELMLPENPL